MFEKEWVSDVISDNEIRNWNVGDVITIKAKPGQGKSFFIKNKLYAYAKKHNERILFLLHRDNTVSQFRNEILREGKEDTIDIRTYQYIEQALMYRRGFDISEYKYIVVDEAHYFISDSTFNNRTDISFEAIMSQNSSVRIFMSATIDDIQEYITIGNNIKTKNYCIRQDDNRVSELTFYNNDDMLDEVAARVVHNGEKAIFFINKARKAYDLYRRFRSHALFNCSKSNPLYRYVDEEAIEIMLTKEKFDVPLLITTSCFDAGSNIVDTDVKHIVIDMRDVDTIIQCAGRKRVQSEDDTFHLYIKNITNQQLGGFESSSSRKLAMARYLLEHSSEELVKKYPRQNDASGVIFDALVDGQIEKKINKLMYLKKSKDIELYRKMKNLGEYGFSKYVASVFGFDDEGIGKRDFHIANDNFSLTNYLDSMVGSVMLCRTDRKELIDKLDVRQNGHILKGIDSINAALNERRMPYRVVEFSTSRMVDGKKKNFKSAWKIEKLEEK